MNVINLRLRIGLGLRALTLAIAVFLAWFVWDLFPADSVALQSASRVGALVILVILVWLVWWPLVEIGDDRSLLVRDWGPSRRIARSDIRSVEVAGDGLVVHLSDGSRLKPFVFRSFGMWGIDRRADAVAVALGGMHRLDDHESHSVDTQRAAIEVTELAEFARDLTEGIARVRTEADESDGSVALSIEPYRVESMPMWVVVTDAAFDVQVGDSMARWEVPISPEGRQRIRHMIEAVVLGRGVEWVAAHRSEVALTLADGIVTSAIGTEGDSVLLSLLVSRRWKAKATRRELRPYRS